VKKLGAKAGLSQDAPVPRSGPFKARGLGSAQAPAVGPGAIWLANSAFCEVNHSSESSRNMQQTTALHTTSETCRTRPISTAQKFETSVKSGLRAEKFTTV